MSKSLIWSRIWFILCIIGIVLVLFGHNLSIILVVGAYIMSKYEYREYLREKNND